MRPCPFIPLVLAALVASCGDDPRGEPLLASTLVGSYDGYEFTPLNGFATVSEGNPVIVVGDGPVACGSESASAPPKGHSAAIGVPELAVGTYGSVFVQMISNVSGFEGVGANQGAVTLTSVTERAIAGEISFAYTDTDGREFSLTGTFEVVHCAY